MTYKFRTYNLSDCSLNNWLWAIPTWGEASKRSYFENKWYQIDVSGFIIK